MGIVEFVKARLDEDEATARAAGGDTWEVRALYRMPHSARTIYRPDERCDLFPGEGGLMPAHAWDHDDKAVDHIARHDPARVLREVAAKRAILEEHGDIDPCDAHNANFESITCDTVLALAAVYADHEDFQSEWR